MSLYNRDETPVRVSFTLPRYILDDLNEYAEAAKTSRSELSTPKRRAGRSKQNEIPIFCSLGGLRGI